MVIYFFYKSISHHLLKKILQTLGLWMFAHPCHVNNKASNTDIFMKAIKCVQTFDYTDFNAS